MSKSDDMVELSETTDNAVVSNPEEQPTEQETEDVADEPEIPAVQGGPSGEPGGTLFHVSDWSGVPNYTCPYCEGGAPYSTTVGSADVKAHIIGSHPGEDPEVDPRTKGKK